MKNLGKILTLLILFLSSLNAGVTAKVTPNDVFAGDTTSYVLNIVGENVEKPIIKDICGNKISATGSQTSIMSINGAYKKSYSLTYQFTPKTSCKIGAVTVEIDGKVEHSNSVELTVLPRTQNLKADFILELKSSQKEVFVGEPYQVTLLLKQKRGAQIVDSKFFAPEFKGFWMKSESKPTRTQDSEYLTTTIVYELAPQREGNLSIEVAELKVAQRNGSNRWGSLVPQVRWRTYYSNEISVKAKALPLGVSIVGDFTINASVKKQEVNPNEAVNLKLEILGSGNFEDIDGFKPFIDNVNIFDEKIKLINNSMSQKFVLVGEQDFIIPSFELKYFDINTQEVKTIKTQEIEIKVKGNIVKKELSITRDISAPSTHLKVKNKAYIEKNNYLYLSISFIIGLILGVLLMLLKRKKVTNKYKTFDIKDEKALLVRLLPYKDSDINVQEIVGILENNIYSKDKVSLDKKRIKEVLVEYNIS